MEDKDHALKSKEKPSSMSESLSVLKKKFEREVEQLTKDQRTIPNTPSGVKNAANEIVSGSGINPEEVISNNL